jgi:4a-hydroxytetrahydrobiopterin dehydratase
MSDTGNSVIAQLVNRRCSASAVPVTPAQIQQWLPQIPQWNVEAGVLSRSFEFKNYYQTIAFVNALAWIAHTEDHHPDLMVSYNRCIVHFTTHSVSGLSENDFISAAKIDALPVPG